MDYIKDRRDFDLQFGLLCETFGKEMSEDLANVYWKKICEKFKIVKDFEVACDKLMGGKYFPRPYDFIRIENDRIQSQPMREKPIPEIPFNKPTPDIQAEIDTMRETYDKTKKIPVLSRNLFKYALQNCLHLSDEQVELSAQWRDSEKASSLERQRKLNETKAEHNRIQSGLKLVRSEPNRNPTKKA